jgi:tRNA(Ile)-lysidine synthetase-like protein
LLFRALRERTEIKMAQSARYPKPGPIGGRLIRRVIAQLKAIPVDLPLTSHILIATSGGSDSIALAHLIAHYGRKITQGGSLELLHINHGWRGAQSDDDEKFVQDTGARWGIPVTVHRLMAPELSAAKAKPPSWEDVARSARQSIYASEAERTRGVIFTGHQADDVAETLLWRLFTGAAKTHGGGIVARHGVELRPFLGVRKSLLLEYLKEEGQEWREDSTNLEGRFLRSRMRLDLMPQIEEIFPRAVEHLLKLALDARVDASKANATRSTVEPLAALFDASGIKIRRLHWEALQAQESRGASTEIYLPGGWKLFHNPKSKPRRWVLEEPE